MLRQVERGLMYGDLVEVASPTLVERYNRALEKLTGRRTTLGSFHIDLSGFAPEIGEEFGDHAYLNPHGCNRQFILISMDQLKAPLLGAHFSTSRTILTNFVEDHRDAILALIARDAVIGELLNSVYRVQSVHDVLSIRTIRIEANTAHGLVTDAAALQKKIDAFEASDDAWWDDQAISAMIDLAKNVGDIRRTQAHITTAEYRQANFFTTHFGGLYVFRDVERPAIIAHDPSKIVDDLHNDRWISIDDRKAVAQFLSDNHLIENIVEAEDLDARKLLQERMQLTLLDHMIKRDRDDERDDDDDDDDDYEIPTRLSRESIRKIMYEDDNTLPPAVHGLEKTLRWLEQGGRRPDYAPDSDAYFYLFRARHHDDRDLVNHLLATYTPLDFRQLFICNKEQFYRTYMQWDEQKRSYVAEFLVRAYSRDKDGVRERLYGPELVPNLAVADEPEILSGPWGPYPQGGDR